MASRGNLGETLETPLTVLRRDYLSLVHMHMVGCRLCARCNPIMTGKASPSDDTSKRERKKKPICRSCPSSGFRSPRGRAGPCILFVKSIFF